MPESLPIKRKWLGYAVVVASLLITFMLWLGKMWWAEDLYDNPWKYPAKIGSHGTLILICWAFILATRFRAVESLFGGLDKVYLAHRRIGECAFFLIFLHPIFLAVAYAESVGGFFRYLWFSDDWVRNTGLIALLAFIVLVVLSIYVKIAYHRWKRTHDLFGVLLILIVIHTVLAGGEIMRYPVLTVWHGGWVVVALAAYGYIRFFYRYIGPQYDYETKMVRAVGNAITEIYLVPVGRPLQPGPGQFVYISIDGDAVSKEPHPFSLSSTPEEQHLRLSIKRLGDWTQDVSQIAVGKPTRIWGPYGHFSKTLLDRPDLPAVMIGGGIGITPFLSIVGSEAFAGRLGETNLIYSVPNEAAAVYRAELLERCRTLPQLTFKQHCSDTEGFIDLSYLASTLNRPLVEHIFMICGPPPMLAALRSILLDANVTARQIVVEDFEIR